MLMICVKSHFASSARAHMAAARGALADVPVCVSVHVFLRSVVTCHTSHITVINTHILLWYSIK